LEDDTAFDLASYRPTPTHSTAELFRGLAAAAEEGRAPLVVVGAESLGRPWKMTMDERVLVDRSKATALRDLTLSHLIHHRGQLSVYLRLREIPVPGSY